MGNEIFNCIQCGIRVSGADLRGDRSHCAACLGISGESTPRPTKDSSKRLRKPSSGTVTAVAVRPRTTEIRPRRTSPAVLIGALSLVGAALVAVTGIPSPVREPDRSSAMTVVVPAPPPEAPARPDPVPAAPEPEQTPVQRPLSSPSLSEDLEARADAAYDSIQEAASALADEGRFDDAMARIRSFPGEFRPTRAWISLEGLRRQIEARNRAR